MVTPLVAFFEITLSRCTTTAKNLLGENFRGIFNSDRYAAYNWVDVTQRQLCWAHIKREFVKISERTGVSKQIGEALLKLEEELFNPPFRTPYCHNRFFRFFTNYKGCIFYKNGENCDGDR